MPTIAAPTIEEAWIEALLRLPDVEQQASFLQAAGFLDQSGLSQLLSYAMTLVRAVPERARQLTSLCADVAEQAGILTIIPRATYLRAQTHAINGEFNTALQLIKSARDSYEAIGEQLEALRTNVGLMHVLNEMGRHQDALDAGEEILQRLAQGEALSEDPQQLTLLAALVNQNRGLCYETIGRYEEALNSYADAESAFMALDMREHIGDIRNNRGIVLLHLGRVSEALAAFEAAASIREAAGLTLQQAQTLSNIGEAHLVLGNYMRSLEAFEQARRLFESLQARMHQHILLRKTADAYLVLNLYPEALAAYEEAIDLLQQAGMTDHLARALWGMGSTLIAQSRFKEADAVLTEAASLFAAADNVPMLSSVMLEQAAVRNALEGPTAALKTAQRALELVADDRWPVQHVYASMRVADLLLPDTDAAEPYLLDAQRVTEILGLPQISFRLARRLGSLRRLQGREAEAEVFFEQAVEQIERLRGTLAQEALRTSFLQDKAAVYEELMALHLSRSGEENVWRGLAVAEQAKSRALVDLITGAIDSRHWLLDDPDVSHHLQSLQSDLNAVYNELMTSGEQRKASLSALHERAIVLEQEIGRERLKITWQREVPDPLEAALPLPVLQKQLPDDHIFVAYHILSEEVLAFVSRGERVKLVRGITNVSVIQSLLQRLTMQIDRFRAGNAFVTRHLPLLEQSARRVLASLHDELVAPLMAVIEGFHVEDDIGKFVIIPHGVLHQVPFHALYDGTAYLIDRWEISYAPSATVFALCQQRTPAEERRGVVVGVPDPLIPAVRTEVEAVSWELVEAGGEVRRLVEADATSEALHDTSPGSQVLHFACHGLFRADNPMFSALKLHNEWFTAADVMRLDLAGALVTLSACESGRSQVILGDEVIGLPRAFLGAGAASVVVSLWLVQDDMTAELMADWYAGLREGKGAARALRAAQLALKERHPHPYYWAPFVLVGKR